MNNLFKRCWQQWFNAWSRIWFKNDDGLQLEIVRFFIGCLLLINYIGLTPYLVDFYSNDGWVNLAAIDYEVNTPWIISIHFWITETWQLFLPAEPLGFCLHAFNSVTNGDPLLFFCSR